MTKILVDVDDQALEVAARALGTKTKKDTINTALRRCADQLRRARALAELRKLGDEGYFDEFLNKNHYRPKP